MKEFYIEQTKESLRNSIELISFQIQEHKDIDSFALEVKKALKLRLTIVDFEGNVIAESHKDKSKMDNHKYRDEIIESTTQEFGYKIRYSKTTKQDLLYLAKEYKHPTGTIYIRLAAELKSINHQILSLALKVLTALVLFFIAIIVVTYKINIQIQAEMQKIVKFLKELTKKKKPTYISSDFSQEFSIITNLLSKVSQILVKKEKQKSKYTSKLEVSNRQKDDIISAISHEFKNPIAVINGYSQTLLDDEALNPNIRKKFLSKIYNNGVKLSDLIDTLRLSIKLDSGQQSMSFTRLNLYDVVHDSIENIKINYPKRDAIIKGEKDLSIKADNSLFSVVISNLIENAFKYSEDEVIVEINEHSVKVIDTGIGISEKNLENITNKFYRVHENSWNNSLGLGLFIVNNIINLHNFKLEIESEENKGSSFIVKF
jgi:signal transduction histidine kinase